MKRWLCAQLVLAAVAVALAPGAQAAEASVNVTTSTGITWVEASVTEADSTDLKVVVLGPAKDGHRKVVQTCRFATAGAGTYRCGFDSSEGSAAARWEGMWRTKVVSSGIVLDRIAFQL